MASRNWIGLFSRSQAPELSNDLERGYEAALLIQSLELEYYGDRRVRPELELSVPRSVQATILGKFRTALEICRSCLEVLKANRSQLDTQELRQLQLIESVVARYSSRRSSGSGRQSAAPDPLPRSLLGLFDSVRRQLDPTSEESVVAGFRRRRDSTLVSLRILLLLVLVPLLIQQVSGTYLIGPALERFSPELSFLNYPRPQLEERAVEKLRIYKEELEFDALLKGQEPPTAEALSRMLADRALELKEDADQESVRAIRNVLSDIAGLLAFVVCVWSKRSCACCADSLMRRSMGSVTQPKRSRSFCLRIFSSAITAPRVDCAGGHCPSPRIASPGQLHHVVHRHLPGDPGDDLQVLDFPLSESGIPVISGHAQGDEWRRLMPWMDS